MSRIERPVERLTNPRADRVRMVASLAGRSARQRTGLFLAEGPQAAGEALRLWLDQRTEAGPTGPAASAQLPQLDALYYAPELLDESSGMMALIDAVHDELRRQSAKDATAADPAARVFIRRASHEVLSAMGDAVTSQGILAVCRLPAHFRSDAPAEDVPGNALNVRGSALSLGLCRVQDPGNAGTMIRTADGAGAGSVLLTRGTVDPFSPKAVRSAAGSHFHVPLIPVPTAADAASAAHRAGMQVLAADGHSDTLLSELETVGDPTLWLMGNEARGLDPTEREAADALVAIPRYGAAESLNVASAAAVCLYTSAMAAKARGERR